MSAHIISTQQFYTGEIKAIVVCYPTSHTATNLHEISYACTMMGPVDYWHSLIKRRSREDHWDLTPAFNQITAICMQVCPFLTLQVFSRYSCIQAGKAYLRKLPLRSHEESIIRARQRLYSTAAPGSPTGMLATCHPALSPRVTSSLG